MATATESDVRYFLPNEIEDVPTYTGDGTGDIDQALARASRKVANYDDVEDVNDAEAIYAALDLLENKYQMPEEHGGPSMDETFAEAPAETLRKKFRRITRSSGFRVL